MVVMVNGRVVEYSCFSQMKVYMLLNILKVINNTMMFALGVAVPIDMERVQKFCKR